MVPLFLCFFSTFYDDLPARTTFGFQSESSVWWNPVETVENLKGFKIVEGDVLVTDSGNGNFKNAIKSKKYLWENGRIPYEFDETFTCSEKLLVLEAMKVIESKTCVRFVENDDRDAFVRFEKEKKGCYAPIGRLIGNEGPMPVNLQSPECFKERGIIEHELLHVVGLFHEQSRPDRDDYVTIHWCNIEPFREKDFLKADFNKTTTFDLPYDYGSIMHYPKWAFSRNGKPTITAKKNPDMILGQRKEPSPNDFAKVIQMYGCKKSEDGDSNNSEGNDLREKEEEQPINYQFEKFPSPADGNLVLGAL